VRLPRARKRKRPSVFAFAFGATTLAGSAASADGLAVSVFASAGVVVHVLVPCAGSATVLVVQHVLVYGETVSVSRELRHHHGAELSGSLLAVHAPLDVGVVAVVPARHRAVGK
jgi:hypothetical protein